MIAAAICGVACLFGGFSIIAGAAIADIIQFKHSRLAHWAYEI